MSLRGKLFYWTPRLLSLGFILFISIFALDVFSGYSGFAVVLPLLVHLLPSFLLLVITIIAWKYELVGTISFLGFAGWYIWDIGFTRPVSWYLAIVLPALVVGILYILSWLQRRNRNVIVK